MTENAYIHIPFCKSKCKYCSFVSYPDIELKKQYIIALNNEIKKNYKGELLKTLYFGGGTPSLLSPNEFWEIINNFNINNSTEITTELNPENITEGYLKSLKNIGINRLSFGCQTFNDEILKFIGRRHNAIDAINAVSFARNCGFENINLDLIYGLPNQTIEMFENDLKKAVELKIPHISLYGLKIDENCYFSKHMPSNLPNEDIQADMYLKANEILKNYNHYEISNFSQNGFESKHNLNYWDNNSYYGFGVAAHGYENNIRYNNTDNLKDYIKNPKRHFHKLSTQEQLEEEIFLGFRKGEGIDIEEINKKYKIDFKRNYGMIIEKYSKYFEKTSNGYKFNNNGFLISNNILSEFLQ